MRRYRHAIVVLLLASLGAIQSASASCGMIGQDEAHVAGDTEPVHAHGPSAVPSFSHAGTDASHEHGGSGESNCPLMTACALIVVAARAATVPVHAFGVESPTIAPGTASGSPSFLLDPPPPRSLT